MFSPNYKTFEQEKAEEDSMPNDHLFKIKSFELISQNQNNITTEKPKVEVNPIPIKPQITKTCSAACPHHKDVNKIIKYPKEKLIELIIPKERDRDSTKPLNVTPVKKTIKFIEDDKNPNLSRKEQLNEIKEKYMPSFRSVRGDGNCFFRSAGFLFVEILLREKNTCEAKQKLNSFYNIFKNKDEIVSKFKLKGGNDSIQDIFNYITESKGKKSIDFIETFISKVFELINEEENEKIEIFENFINFCPVFDMCLLITFRILGFIYYESNKDNEVNCIESVYNQERPDELLQVYDKEAEGTIIHGLFEILDVDYKLVSLMEKDKRTREFTILIDGTQNPRFPKLKEINLFFRPGHYDVGYNFEQSKEYYNI